MILSESELRGIQEHRFERFFRVWCTEKAPCLTELAILLRPSYDRVEGSLRVRMEGIHAFLDYFDRHVERELRDIRTLTLKIFIDNWCETSHTLVQYTHAPQSVFELEASG